MTQMSGFRTLLITSPLSPVSVAALASQAPYDGRYGRHKRKGDEGQRDLGRDEVRKAHLAAGFSRSWRQRMLDGGGEVRFVHVAKLDAVIESFRVERHGQEVFASLDIDQPTLDDVVNRLEAVVSMMLSAQSNNAKSGAPSSKAGAPSSKAGAPSGAGAPSSKTGAPSAR